MPLVRRAVAGQEATPSKPHNRKDVTFASYGETISAWLYPSKKFSSASPPNKGPAIVLAHGLGAIKDMRLDAYCERFQAEGYTCLAFDYRCNGESTGLPRGLVDVEEQLKDFAIAIEYVRALPYVNPDQIGLFGSSFGGGNVIRVAAKDPTLKAVISQCPFTSGIHSSMSTGIGVLPELLYLGLKDVLLGTNENPITVPLAGVPGEAALMNSPDAKAGCEALIPDGYVHPNVVPARFVLQIPFMRPGAYASSIKTPILFAICGQDTVAPPKPTLAYAKKAPNGTIKYYKEMGHFDIYLGAAFDKATADYVDFLRLHLPVKDSDELSREPVQSKL